MNEGGLSEASLEVGVEVHMRNRTPGEDQGWHMFDYIAMMAKSKSTDQVERYCYISDSTGECLEVVRIDDDNEMPRKIWIKVGKPT